MRLAKLVLSILKKDDIVTIANVRKTLVQTKESLTDSTHVQLGQLAKIVKGLPESETDVILKLLNNVGYKFRTAEIALLALSSFAKDCSVGLQYLIDGFDEYEVITSNTLTAKTAAMLTVTEDIILTANLLSSIALAVPYLIEGKSVVYKAKLTELQSLLRSSVVVVQYLYRGNVISIVKEATSLNDAEPTAKEGNQFIPNVNNFSYPVYTARKWWIDITFSRYERNKVSASLLQLKLEELNSRTTYGESSATLDRSIERLENKLIKLERTIKKYEET